MREEAVSRRAVYHTQRWLTDLPQPHGEGEMLAELLAYQLARQSGDKVLAEKHQVDVLARDLARWAAERQDGLRWLERLLSVAEFLARETRAAHMADKKDQEAAACAGT